MQFYLQITSRAQNMVDFCSAIHKFHWLFRFLCWLSITLYRKTDKAIMRKKSKTCSRQWEFELLNVNFHRFFSEETSEIVWFLECIRQGFVRSSIFWVLRLSRVNSVWEFLTFFSSNLNKILQNTWRIDFFPLSHHQLWWKSRHLVKNIA